MKEFQVNNYLALKLEEEKTVIYVAGKRFQQCKYLLMDIPIEKIDSFDEIKSIDEAAKKLDHSLEGQQRRIVKIPPEVEFWGHCSNLQAWYEHMYDSRLLHSNLAFPLLKKLMNAGDKLAKQVFREEVAEKLITGDLTTIAFFFEEIYVDSLNKKTIWFIIREIQERNFSSKAIYYDLRLSLLKKLMIIGDLRAKKLFKKEILDLLLENDPSLNEMLYLNRYIYYLTRKEFWSVFGDDGKILKEIEQEVKKYKIIKDKKVEEKKIDKFEYFKPVSHFYIGSGPMIFKFKNGRVTHIGIFGNEKEVQERSNGDLDIIDGSISNLVIRKLPFSIYKLEALEELVLFDVGLETLPTSLGRLNRLRVISVENNTQLKLPLSIWNITSLEVLDLTRNNLKNIPDIVCNLLNLKKLFLGENKLKTLPISLNQLKSLKLLHLKGNPLGIREFGIF